MKKVVFGITSLTAGGAERVLVDIANKLVDNYSVEIFTLYGQGIFEEQLDKRVKVISLYKEAYNSYSKATKIKISLSLILPMFRKRIYNKYFKNKYDVEVAFLEGPITWLLQTKSDAKKIVWVHNDLEKTFEGGVKNYWKQSLNKKAYDAYQKIIFVSKDNLKIFKNIFKDNKIKKEIIYNYIDVKRIETLAREKADSVMKKESPTFCVVCRLSEQKGLERLIKVHKKLINDGFTHRIYIVGDGPLKVSLLDLIDKTGCNDTFILLGQKSNPYPYIKEADYFMLASLYEGYGMVLVEAKILGKKILLTDTAAREVVEDYPNSIIMKNSEEGIYKGIKEVLTKKDKKKTSKKYENDNLICDIINMIEK